MAAIVPVLPGIELKRILYATDFSDASRAALPLVAAIARHYGARILAAHVWCPAPYPFVSSRAVTVLDRREQLEMRKQLDSMLASELLQGIPTESMLVCGSPTEELERIVRRQRVDLAVASTHGRIGLEHRVLGSITEEMVRCLSCPVVSIGPQAARNSHALNKISSILFPTDFSHESHVVFPYLASLAHEFRSRLTVLHVISPENTKHPGALDQVEALRERMERALGNEISPRCTAEFVVEEGKPVDQILAYARRINADLIGMGVRGATDIAMHFRETTGYRILCDAKCPVLTHHANGMH
jgi:nucleotide-binding universal stress UspA family protein